MELKKIGVVGAGTMGNGISQALAKKLGKTPVQVRNSPGFVVNRLLCPMINEAGYLGRKTKRGFFTYQA